MLNVIGSVLFWLAITIGAIFHVWVFVMWLRMRKQDKIDAKHRRACWVARSITRKKDERAKN